MKTAKLILTIVAVMITAASCGHRQEAQKALVLYYSQTGNTKMVAEEIATRMGADVEEILAVNPFEGDFQATIERCMRERELGVKTEIQPMESDFAAYDIIFIGYPVWFGTYAPPVATLLEQIDLSGKKVVPFCTFGSGGLESSVKDMAAMQPKAQIMPGYGVRAARMDVMPTEVEQFLLAGGYIEGEYTPLADFGEQHAVSEDEAAIFNAAVGDYPMIHAEARTVASRTLANGIEYMFNAVDTPREEGPDMPPAGDITVYVTVNEGAAPVFTKVIR